MVYGLFKAASVIRKAHGQALYSGAGAWTRILEFAKDQGKSNYIAEAESNLAILESDLKSWREEAEAAGVDIASFEKMRATAYETTDLNIKNGLNPLAYLDEPKPSDLR